jgi:glutamate synthase (NADPH/NADH) large chain
MSKMGISTYQSYCGAQIFDAVGLSRAFVDEIFLRHRDPIEGAASPRSPRRPRAGTPTRSAIRRSLSTALEVGGEYAYPVRGETHAWTPETVSLLQHAVRGNARERYDAFAKLLNEQSERL